MPCSIAGWPGCPSAGYRGDEVTRRLRNNAYCWCRQLIQRSGTTRISGLTITSISRLVNPSCAELDLVQVLQRRIDSGLFVDFRGIVFRPPESVSVLMAGNFGRSRFALPFSRPLARAKSVAPCPLKMRCRGTWRSVHSGEIVKSCHEGPQSVIPQNRLRRCGPGRGMLPSASNVVWWPGCRSGVCNTAASRLRRSL